MIHLLLQLTAELLIRIRVTSIFSMLKNEVYGVEELGKDMIMHGRCGYGLRTGFKPSELFLALPSDPHLPHRLERLAIAWDCDENQDTDDFWAYKVPDLAELAREVALSPWFLLHA
ncbi:hypothetical protein DFH06DRAFT_1327387 [Mycena polygramma]|nr:hypothetical protein DFH06DRAFT_1327387 [Mycena polygramma]